MAEVQFQSAVFFVRDVQAARYFYEDLLGQTVAMDHGPNVGFEGGFAIWQIDHALQTIFGRAPQAAGRLGRENSELYFEAVDLEAIWVRLSDAGVAVVHPLREQPWGQRVVRVYDPDGHIVEVGEPMWVVVQRFLAQEMSAAAVAERTSMPLAVVEQIAQNLGA